MKGRTIETKLRRDLLRSRRMIGTVLLILSVGIACYVAMRTSQLNLESALARYYARCHLADVWIDLKKAPVLEVRERLQMPGIAEVVPRVTSLVSVDLSSVDRPVSGQLISLPERPARLNDLILVRGSWPDPGGDDELLVIQQFAVAHGLDPGDELHLILNNRRQAFRISGIVLSAEFVYLMSPGSIVPASEHFGVFYMPERAAADVFDFEGACNSVLLRLDPKVADAPRVLLDAIERSLTPFGVLAVTPRREFPSHWFISDELKQLGTTGLILPTIFLAVAVLVLNILIIRLVEQQRTIIGILKAFGYTNGQIRSHFLKFALTIGFLGGAIGAILGFVLSAGLTMLYREFYVFPDLVNSLSAEAHLVGFALAIGASGLGAVRGAGLAVRLHPAEAMRPKPPPMNRAVLLERFSFIWGQLDLGWRMVLRGLARQRARSAAGLLAALLASAIMLTSLGMQDALRFIVKFQFNEVQRADAGLVFHGEKPFGVVREVGALPGVDHVEPVLEVACSFVHGWRTRRGGITGIVPGSRLTVPRDRTGRAVPIPDDGLMMTRALADELQLRIGDLVTIKPVRGQQESFTMPLVSVVDSYLGLAAYANFYSLNRAIGEWDSVSSVSIALNRDESSSSRFARAVKGVPAVQSVNLVREQKREFEALLATSNISISVLILFAGVIMFGSLCTGALITLSERQREIATLRTLGYHEREISRLFLRENLFLNLTGAMLGLPLGYALLILMSVAYQTEAFRIPVRVEEKTWLLTLLLAMCFTFFAQVFVRRAIRRLPWRQVLNVGD